MLVLDLGQVYHGPYCGLLLELHGRARPEDRAARGRHRPPPQAQRRALPARDAQLEQGVGGPRLQAPRGQGAVPRARAPGRRRGRELRRRRHGPPGPRLGGAARREPAPGLRHRQGLRPERPLSRPARHGPHDPGHERDHERHRLPGPASRQGGARRVRLPRRPCTSSAASSSALLHRERTGEGQLVEVSMHEAAVVALASALGAFMDGDGGVPERTGNRHPALAIAPYNVYPTRDGFVAIFTASERHWHSIARVLGREDLLDNPDYASTPARAAHMEEIDALVEAWTRGRGKDEVMAELTRRARAVRARAHHRRGGRRPASAGARASGRRWTIRGAARRCVPNSPIRLHGSAPGRVGASGAAARSGHRPRARRAPRPRIGGAGGSSRPRRHRAGHGPDPRLPVIGERS